MNTRQSIFPIHPIAESLSAPSIELEGQKVLFDKKVSLLPADMKKLPQNSQNGKPGS